MMNIYECTLDSYDPDWICAESEEQALEIYQNVSGNTDIPIIEKLSEDRLKSFYMLDFNESDPGELDEDDEDYDPNYDPDQWIAGGKIIETFFEYLQRQTKPHFLENFQNQ